MYYKMKSLPRHQVTVNLRIMRVNIIVSRVNCINGCISRPQRQQQRCSASGDGLLCVFVCVSQSLSQHYNFTHTRHNALIHRVTVKYEKVKVFVVTKADDSSGKSSGYSLGYA